MTKIAKILSGMRVGKKDRPRLDKMDSSSTAGVDGKADAREKLGAITSELSDLQFKLYAEGKTGLLVVFQAMDTAGKDGVIRKVIGPLNAQGVNVASFKQPSPLELSHDYLWRIHALAPAKGMIRIFNRSHYEDVLVRRVHKLEPEEVLEKRYRQINDFERYLSENNIVILKFFLHISKDEQKERLEARLKDPDRRWKFSAADVEERKFWDKYREAYEIALHRCNGDYAPWHIIPADKKWYRDWAVGSIMLDAMRRINPKFPREQEGLDKVKII